MNIYKCVTKGLSLVHNVVTVTEICACRRKKTSEHFWPFLHMALICFHLNHIALSPQRPLIWCFPPKIHRFILHRKQTQNSLSDFLTAVNIQSMTQLVLLPLIGSFHFCANWKHCAWKWRNIFPFTKMIEEWQFLAGFFSFYTIFLQDLYLKKNHVGSCFAHRPSMCKTNLTFFKQKFPDSQWNTQSGIFPVNLHMIKYTIIFKGEN